MTAAKKTSGAPAKKKPSYITFSQNLDPEYWKGWDPAVIAAGDPRAIGEEVLRRYEEAGGECTGFWIIKHDKDILDDGSAKADHVHVIIQQGGNGRSLDGKLYCPEIDAALGFEKSVIRAPGRGGRIENAQAYLIHAKDPKKHQYGVDEVVTLRGENYTKIEESFRDAWARRAVMGRAAAISKKEWSDLGDALVQKVLDGEVNELDVLKDKTLGDVYARNKTNVDLAFSFRARREMHAEVEKLRTGVFEKTVIWAMGASDQGKSYLIESVASELSDRLGWTVFRATAKNGPDDYNGESIFMMNEPSSRVMEWADFLQLLDPRQAGPISARYVNKREAAPRVILIAVSVDPVEFGFFMPGKRTTEDSLDQLVRRITLMIEARKVDDEPHYSISTVGETLPRTRHIQIPGTTVRDRFGNEHDKFEQLSISYGQSMTLRNLDQPTSVDVVLGEIAEKSPDADLAVEDSRTFSAHATAQGIRPLTDELVDRGVISRDLNSLAIHN